MSARPLYRGWHVVGAVLVALMLCGTTTIVATFGIVTAHLTRAFGWSQAAMATALSLFLIATLVAVPVVGIAVDRFGSRRTAGAGIVAFAALLALAGKTTTSLSELMIFYALFGTVGAFTNPIVYIRALSAWFDRRRGFALGLAVAGQGVGGAILPMAVEHVSEAFGWRYAFYALAAGLILFVLPLVALFVRDDPAEAGVPFGDTVDPVHTDQPAAPSGFTVAQALRTRAFWIIVTVFLLFGMTSYALTANFVALMLQRGAGTLPQIAMLSSIAGVAMIAGRLVFGWLLDRFPVPIVGAGGVLCAAAALGILLRVDTIGVAAVTMSVLMGVAMGAETDLLSILVGRYFGQRAISRIYAWHNVGFLLGAALGPPLFARLLGHFANTDAPILTLIVLVILSAALLLVLRTPEQIGGSQVDATGNDLPDLRRAGAT